jgi:hypothetical protein
MLRSQISLVPRRRCQSIHKYTVKDACVLKGPEREGDSNVVFFFCIGSFVNVLTRNYCYDLSQVNAFNATTFLRFVLIISY